MQGFYNSDRVQNYAIQGNTACDFLQQLDYISGEPTAFVIGTMDGNGIIRGVSPEVSEKTLIKIALKIKSKFPLTKIVFVGTHQIKLIQANKIKTEVNRRMKLYSEANNICYVETYDIFGVGSNDVPPNEYMNDQIHPANNPFYPELNKKIKNQCGVDLG